MITYDKICEFIKLNEPSQKALINNDYNMFYYAKDLCIWLDPLDGTKEFVKGKLQFVTCMIGVSYKDRPLFGVISRPFELSPNQDS